MLPNFQKRSRPYGNKSSQHNHGACHHKYQPLSAGFSQNLVRSEGDIRRAAVNFGQAANDVYAEKPVSHNVWERRETFSRLTNHLAANALLTHNYRALFVVPEIT